nr:Unknown Function [uncultured bacterium]
MVKKSLSKYTSLEKTLTVAGLALVVLGVVASAYSLYVNARFVHEPLDLGYYLRNFIMLAGGFATGYFLTKGQTNKHNRAFRGVVYAALSVVLFGLLDQIRAVFLFDLMMNHPYGWYSFMLMPYTALILAVLVSLHSRFFSKSGLTKLAKGLFVFSFLAVELYYWGQGLYLQITHPVSTGTPGMPVWFDFVAYFADPLVVAAIAFLCLTRVKRPFARLFYASLIGVFVTMFTMSAWEFRIDPSNDATNVFQIVVTLLTIVLGAGLIWKTRKSVK